MITSPARLLLPAGYMLCIFVLSSIPGDLEDPDTLLAVVFAWVSPQWQNLLHIPLYGGLTAAWLWALEAQNPRARGWAAVVFSLAFSIFDESYQLYVPGRFSSYTDLALNATGIALVLCLFVYSRTSQPLINRQS